MLGTFFIPQCGTTYSILGNVDRIAIMIPNKWSGKSNLQPDESCAESIRESVLSLGFKYAKLAEEAKSVREAKAAFGLADKAFRLALDAEKQMIIRKDYSRMNLAFLSQISVTMERSAVWTKYMDFCSEQKLLPMNKGQLFKKLEQLGFTLKKSGSVLVCPPSRPTNELLEARNDAASLQIDVNFEAA